MNNDVLNTNIIIPKKGNNSILVSFVIPTYNRLETLKSTINSIVPNGKIDYEIVITDNTDINRISSTKEYLEGLNNKHISYYVNEKNYGMVDNWNVGLKQSIGEYIAYIHDDDMIANCYFDVIYELLFNKLKGKNIGFIKARFNTFSDENSIIDNKCLTYKYDKIIKFESLLNGIGATYAPTCGILFKKDALLKIGGFNSNYHPCADHIVGFKILDIGYEGYITRDIIGHYRWGINESLKKETLIATVEKNFAIREYFYSNNFLYSIFGFVFKKYYYTNKFNQQISEDEMIQRKRDYISCYFIYIIIGLVNRLFVKTCRFIIKFIK